MIKKLFERKQLNVVEENGQPPQVRVGETGNEVKEIDIFLLFCTFSPFNSSLFTMNKIKIKHEIITERIERYADGSCMEKMPEEGKGNQGKHQRRTRTASIPGSILSGAPNVNFRKYLFGRRFEI